MSRLSSLLLAPKRLSGFVRSTFARAPFLNRAFSTSLSTRSVKQWSRVGTLLTATVVSLCAPTIIVEHRTGEQLEDELQVPTYPGSPEMFRMQLIGLSVIPTSVGKQHVDDCSENYENMMKWPGNVICLCARFSGHSDEDSTKAVHCFRFIFNRPIATDLFNAILMKGVDDFSEQSPKYGVPASSLRTGVMLFEALGRLGEQWSRKDELFILCDRGDGDMVSLMKSSGNGDIKSLFSIQSEILCDCFESVLSAPNTSWLNWHREHPLKLSQIALFG